MKPYSAKYNVNPEYVNQIFFTSKEYKQNVDKLQSDYLKKNSDFDRIYFTENEREFYAKLYFDCCNISGTSNPNVKNIEKLAPEIINTLKQNNGQWNYNLNEEYKAGFKAIINYLDKRIKVYNAIKNQTENPYPNIFTDGVAYHIFQELHNKFMDDSDYCIANYSFIFRKMKSDGRLLSSVRNTDYKDFLSQLPKPINIDKIKTVNDFANNFRNKIYELIIEPFQIK